MRRGALAQAANGIEGQPVLLKWGTFTAASRDELKLRADVFIVRQRGHGEFTIMSKMVKSPTRLWYQSVGTFQCAPSSIKTWVGLKSNLYGHRTAVICLQRTGTRYGPHCNARRRAGSRRVDHWIPPPRRRLGSLASSALRWGQVADQRLAANQRFQQQPPPTRRRDSRANSSNKGSTEHRWISFVDISGSLVHRDVTGWHKHKHSRSSAARILFRHSFRAAGENSG